MKQRFLLLIAAFALILTVIVAPATPASAGVCDTVGEAASKTAFIPGAGWLAKKGAEFSCDQTAAVVGKAWGLTLGAADSGKAAGLPGFGNLSLALNTLDQNMPGHTSVRGVGMNVAANEKYDPAKWSNERILPPWRWASPSSELHTNNNFLNSISMDGAAFQLSKMIMTVNGTVWTVAVTIFGYGGDIAGGIAPLVQERLLVPILTALGFGGDVDGPMALLIPLIISFIILFGIWYMIKSDRQGTKRVLRGLFAMILLFAMGAAAMRGPETPLSPMWVQNTADNMAQTVATSPAGLLGQQEKVETGFAKDTVCADYVKGMQDRYADKVTLKDLEGKSVLVNGTNGASNSMMSSLWAQMVMVPYKNTQFNGSAAADNSACILMDIDAEVPGPIRVDAWERHRGKIPTPATLFFSNTLEAKDVTSVVTAFAWCKPNGDGVNPDDDFKAVNARDDDASGGKMTKFEGLTDTEMCEAWWNDGDLTPGDASAAADVTAVPAKVLEEGKDAIGKAANGEDPDPLGAAKEVLEDTGPFNFVSGQQVDTATKSNGTDSAEARKLIRGVSGDVSGGTALAGALLALVISVILLWKLAGLVFKIFLFNALVSIGSVFLIAGLLMWAMPTVTTQQHGKKLVGVALTAPILGIVFSMLLYFFITLTGILSEVVGNALGGVLAVLVPAAALYIVLKIAKKVGMESAFDKKGSVAFATAAVLPGNGGSARERIRNRRDRHRSDRAERRSSKKLDKGGRVKRATGIGAGLGADRLLGKRGAVGQRIGSGLGRRLGSKLNMSPETQSKLTAAMGAKGKKIDENLSRRKKDARGEKGNEAEADAPKPKPTVPGDTKPPTDPKPKPKPGDPKPDKHDKKKQTGRSVAYDSAIGNPLKATVAGLATGVKTGNVAAGLTAAGVSAGNSYKGTAQKWNAGRKADRTQAATADAVNRTAPPSPPTPETTNDPMMLTPRGADGKPLNAPLPPAGTTVRDPSPGTSRGHSWGVTNAGNPPPWIGRTSGPPSQAVAGPIPMGGPRDEGLLSPVAAGFSDGQAAGQRKQDGTPHVPQQPQGHTPNVPTPRPSQPTPQPSQPSQSNVPTPQANPSFHDLPDWGPPVNSGNSAGSWTPDEKFTPPTPAPPPPKPAPPKPPKPAPPKPPTDGRPGGRTPQG